jgi:hypothetical protein
VKVVDGIKVFLLIPVNDVIGFFQKTQAGGAIQGFL